MRHIITAEERHVLTSKEKSNRKGKKFGSNQRTFKALAKYQQQASLMTREEWLDAAKESGLSYYRRTRLAELLTFARSNTPRIMESPRIKALEDKIKELEERIAILENRNVVEICEPRELKPVELNEPLKPLTVFNAKELKAIVETMK